MLNKTFSFTVRTIKNRAEQKPAVFGESRTFDTKRAATGGNGCLRMTNVGGFTPRQ